MTHLLRSALPLSGITRSIWASHWGPPALAKTPAALLWAFPFPLAPLPAGPGFVSGLNHSFWSLLPLPL